METERARFRLCLSQKHRLGESCFNFQGMNYIRWSWKKKKTGWLRTIFHIQLLLKAHEFFWGLKILGYLSPLSSPGPKQKPLEVGVKQEMDILDHTNNNERTYCAVDLKYSRPLVRDAIFHRFFEVAALVKNTVLFWTGQWNKSFLMEFSEIAELVAAPTLPRKATAVNGMC